MHSWLQDTRYALRQLRRSPGFAITAVLTLALGIGATTAIFSLYLQVLLRSLPVHDPQHLVLLRYTGGWGTNNDISAYGDPAYYFSFPMYQDLRKHSGKVFSDMAASGAFSIPMRAGDRTETMLGDFVTGSYFATLGVRPALGRLIGPSDDAVRGGNPVVVLSYSEWQQRFGGSPAVLNQTVDLNAHPFTVIGVAPPGFAGLNPRRPDQIFIPMGMEPVLPTHDRSWLDVHNAIWINVVARLRPEVTPQSAEVELNPLWWALRKSALPYFGNRSRGAAQAFMRTHLFVTSGMRGLPFLREQVGPKVELLMAMALLVLLIAGVNFANLLLVRGTIRAKEIGVRAALGAPRRRLMVWILTESLLLTFLGGVIGIGLGWLPVRPLSVHLLGHFGNVAFLSSSLEGQLLIFACVAMLLTGLLSCLPSMLLTTRPDLTRVLHEGATQSSKGAGRLRLTFTTVQILLSFVLLVGACLLGRTLYNLRTVDVGLRTDHLLTFSTDARSVGSSPDQTAALMERMVDAIRREPAIVSVGYAVGGVLNHNHSTSDITIAGYEPPNGEEMRSQRNSVSPGFFTALGIPLMTGRVFTQSDQAKDPKVGIVNDLFADHYFGGPRQALGQMFCFGSGKGSVPNIRIVGVVKSARTIAMDTNPVPAVFVPFDQDTRHSGRSAYFYVRTALPPAQLSSEIRGAVQSVNPALPLDSMGTMTEQVQGDISTPHLLAVLSISFALLAALLAAIGIYGVLAYSMAQRTREIGIRMALGADRFQVVQLVIRQVAAMAVAALVLGIPLSLLLSRYLRAELYQVAYNDPWSFAAAALVSLAAVAAASYFPARRAASVDPMCVLRSE